MPQATAPKLIPWGLYIFPVTSYSPNLSFLCHSVVMSGIKSHLDGSFLDRESSPNQESKHLPIVIPLLDAHRQLSFLLPFAPIILPNTHGANGHDQFTEISEHFTQNSDHRDPQVPLLHPQGLLRLSIRSSLGLDHAQSATFRTNLNTLIRTEPRLRRLLERCEQPPS